MSLCFSLLSFHLILLSAINDIESFSVTIDSGNTANTAGIVYITLWFNFTIYQYQLPGSNVGQTYIANRQSSPYFTTFGSSDCHKPEYNRVAEAKILIQNSNSDAVAIISSNITTTSGTWYGWGTICIVSGAVGYTTGKTCSSNCAGCSSTNMGTYQRLCVDADSYDCGPYRQIVYFDISAPNQEITNAEWADGTNVWPEIITCEPTSHPSVNPTIIPTSTPTKSPSLNPTFNPSMLPSSNPTISPTKFPSFNPTIFPSVSPITNAPSFPTHLPSFNPSSAPFVEFEQDGAVQDIVSTKSAYDSEENDKKVENAKTNSFLIYTSIIIAVVVLFFCGCIILFFICKKKHQKRKQEIQKIFVNSNRCTSTSEQHVQAVAIGNMTNIEIVPSPTITAENKNGTFVGIQNNGTIMNSMIQLGHGSMSPIKSFSSDQENNYIDQDDMQILDDVNVIYITPGSPDVAPLRQIGSLRDDEFIVNDIDDDVYEFKDNACTFNTKGNLDVHVDTEEGTDNTECNSEDDTVVSDDIVTEYETVGQ